MLDSHTSELSKFDVISFPNVRMFELTSLDLSMFLVSIFNLSRFEISSLQVVVFSSIRLTSFKSRMLGFRVTNL